MIDLNDDDDLPVVNIFEYCLEHGLSEAEASQVVIHLLLTQTYGMASEARAAADHLGYNLPFIVSGNDKVH